MNIISEASAELIRGDGQGWELIVLLIYHSGVGPQGTKRLERSGGGVATSGWHCVWVKSSLVARAEAKALLLMFLGSESLIKRESLEA